MRRIQPPDLSMTTDPTDFLSQPIPKYDPRYVKVKEIMNPDGTVSRFATAQAPVNLAKESQTDITADGMSICSEILGKTWLSGDVLKKYFDIINTGPLKGKNGHVMDPLAVQLIKSMISSDNYFKKHDFSTLKYLIIPISNAQFINERGRCHWSVLAFCKNSKSFYYFDSLNTHNLENARLITTKFSKVLGVDKDDAIKVCKCPEQNFGYDCGVYAIIAVERLVKDIIANKGINGNCLEGLSLNEFDVLKKRCLLAYVLQNKESITKEKIFSIMFDTAHKKAKSEREHKRSAGKNAGIPGAHVKGNKVNTATKKIPTTSNSSKAKTSAKPKNTA